MAMGGFGPLKRLVLIVVVLAIGLKIDVPSFYTRCLNDGEDTTYIETKAPGLILFILLKQHYVVIYPTSSVYFNLLILAN